MDSIDYAALLLRVSVGALFLAHAWMKYAVFTPKGAADYFRSLGVPGSLAYVAIAAETLGGLALIFGVGTRAAALLLVPLMLGTIVLEHASADSGSPMKEEAGSIPPCGRSAFCPSRLSEAAR